VFGSLGRGIGTIIWKFGSCGFRAMKIIIPS
jgi:hypothetical protein